jgi:DNA-binding MarR family transcriptional regulator
MTQGTAPQAKPPGPAPSDLQELLSTFVTAYVRELGTTAGRYGLTAAQTRALALLFEPVAMRTLADKLYCDASNVTGIIDRLESRGLVQRHADEHDRRIKKVTATDTGRELAVRVYAEVPRIQQALDSLTPAERATLATMLTRLIPILEGEPAGG